MFFTLSDPDDYTSAIGLTTPVNNEQVISGPVVRQVAPDSFLHPVHAIRLFLDNIGGTVTDAGFGRGRIQTVDSTKTGNPTVPPPVSEPSANFAQPPQGAGPEFFGIRHQNKKPKYYY
jgi:hypothetical protein